jgi:small subunit ribosomal protein S6
MEILADVREKVKASPVKNYALCFSPTTQCPYDRCKQKFDRYQGVCYTQTLNPYRMEERLALNRSYELMYIVRPDLAKANLEETINKFQKAVNESGGQVVTTDEWGLRLLAHEIKNLDKGYYVLMEFNGTPDQVEKLEDRLKLDENILRYQVVRQ